MNWLRPVAGFVLLTSFCGCGRYGFPDTPGSRTCVTDEDCGAGGCQDGRCVDCRTNRHCNRADRCVDLVCVPRAACGSNMPCAAGFCIGGRCMDCLDNSDCGPTDLCRANVCVPVGNGCDDPAACGPHGTCDDSQGAIVCSCDTGYSGERCEKCAIGYQFYGDRACRLSDPCTGDARCEIQHRTCTNSDGVPLCGDCSGGYHLSGDTCVADQECGPNSCNGHGTCDDSQNRIVCTCDTGYDGERCERCATGFTNYGDGKCRPVNPCALDTTCALEHRTCSNAGGLAVCGGCIGGYHLSGSFCLADQQCGPNSCNGHGLCDDSTNTVVCTCDTGYSGNNCERCAIGYEDYGDQECRPADPCASDTDCALQQRTCINVSGVASCDVCVSGYHESGIVCVIDEPCLASSCSSHGTCDDSTGVVVCSCLPEYLGDHCEGCIPGYQDYGDGECRPSDPCASNTSCALQYRACVNSGGFAICDSCIAGYYEDAGVCAVDCWSTPALPNLTIDGTSQTLSGSQEYNIVRIVNGGILFVADYDGAGNSNGLLDLRANEITVEAGSSIVADGRGYRGATICTTGAGVTGEGPGGGEGDGRAGAGAGYGGAGGNCSNESVSGGMPYGDATSFSAEMGSGGGASEYFGGCGVGGDGGGGIILRAMNISIAGTVSSDGAAGIIGSGEHGSGGGSGGGILLYGHTVTVSGTISAKGAGGNNRTDISGRDGGGGGAGGRIKAFCKTADLASATFDVGAGSAGAGSMWNGVPGQVGTSYSAPITDCL